MCSLCLCSGHQWHAIAESDASIARLECESSCAVRSFDYDFAASCFLRRYLGPTQPSSSWKLASSEPHLALDCSYCWPEESWRCLQEKSRPCLNWLLQPHFYDGFSECSIETYLLCGQRNLNWLYCSSRQAYLWKLSWLAMLVLWLLSMLSHWHI